MGPGSALSTNEPPREGRELVSFEGLESQLPEATCFGETDMGFMERLPTGDTLTAPCTTANMEVTRTPLALPS